MRDPEYDATNLTEGVLVPRVWWYTLVGIACADPIWPRAMVGVYRARGVNCGGKCT